MDVRKSLSKLISDIDRCLHKARENDKEHLKKLGLYEELKPLLSESSKEGRHLKRGNLEDIFGNFPNFLSEILDQDYVEEMVKKLNLDKDEIIKLRRMYVEKRNPNTYFKYMDYSFFLYAELRAKGYPHKKLTGKDFP